VQAVEIKLKDELSVPDKPLVLEYRAHHGYKPLRVVKLLAAILLAEVIFKLMGNEMM
jgi:hypothetical protein